MKFGCAQELMHRIVKLNVCTNVNDFTVAKRNKTLGLTLLHVLGRERKNVKTKNVACTLITSSQNRNGAHVCSM